MEKKIFHLLAHSLMDWARLKPGASSMQAAGTQDTYLPLFPWPLKEMWTRGRACQHRGHGFTNKATKLAP